jgi:hypothetical protein
MGNGKEGASLPTREREISKERFFKKRPPLPAGSEGLIPPTLGRVDVGADS